MVMSTNVLVEFLSGEQLVLRLVKAHDKKKLTLADPRGKLTSLSPDKVLFRHGTASFEELAGRLEALQAEVDVPLLWESAREELADGPLEPAELAELYFGDRGPAHSSAVFRALSADGLHFRRRGPTFVPRSPEELSALREQREAEARVARELSDLEAALEQRPLGPEVVERLQQVLRGGDDKLLCRVLEGRSPDPLAGAFELLLGQGHLPPTAQLEVLQADLKEEHPEPVLRHALALEQPAEAGEAVRPAAFSIDDPHTREVDDVLSARRDGLLTRVDIDIADVAALVRPGDPVDREAMRRATTVYLPIGTTYMLPERVGCELASLDVGAPRRAVRTSVWLDERGEVEGCELSRVTIEVSERLDYEAADRLLADDGDQSETARTLRRLQHVAEQRAEARRQAGALFFPRREWKLHVSDEGARIEVQPIPLDSPSRALVAEMMILANALAAQEATEQGIPIIYRAQPRPSEPLPEVDPTSPAAFEALRRFIKPAALSLGPAEHWGLGLEAYTQVSSPLRRYADLVVQRQLGAALEGEAPPYSTDELLKVLATAEATEREHKRLEALVKERWALEYVARLEQKSGLDALVMGEHPAGGHRVQLLSCGAVGVLVDDRRHEPGSEVTVAVQKVKPRRGVLRLLPEG